MRTRELRRLTSGELEAMNVDLSNQVQTFMDTTKKEQRKITDELDRRGRVERGEESDDVPVKDDDAD